MWLLTVLKIEILSGRSGSDLDIIVGNPDVLSINLEKATIKYLAYGFNNL